MDKKSLYAVLMILFFIMWIGGIIIGYKKGKKKAEKGRIYLQHKKIYQMGISINTKKKIMESYPVLYESEKEVFIPVKYNLKLNIEERFSIIDEKGNPIQSKTISLDTRAFVYNIIDTDIKTSEELKKLIKFKDEDENLKEEFYKGIPEEFEEDNFNKKIKDPNYEIHTNL